MRMKSAHIEGACQVGDRDGSRMGTEWKQVPRGWFKHASRCQRRLTLALVASAAYESVLLKVPLGEFLSQSLRHFSCLYFYKSLA